MAGVGTKILAVDYNTIQTTVARVLGKTASDADYGYGQDVLSSQVDTTKLITAEQWTNLRSDLLKTRQHQTGVDESANLGTIPGGTVTVKEATRSAYLSMATACDTNRLITPPYGTGVALPQAELVDFLTPQVSRYQAWNATIQQTVTITWPSYDDARYFFNAGGQIQFSATRSGGTASKDLNWSTLLNEMGIIKFTHTATTSSDTLPNSYSTNTGYYDLVPTDPYPFVTLYTKYGRDSYNANYFRLLGRYTGSTRNQIEFVLQFNDADGPNNPGAAGQIAPYHTDENVTGTLSTFIKCLRPMGIGNVTLPRPPCASTDIV